MSCSYGLSMAFRLPSRRGGSTNHATSDRHELDALRLETSARTCAVWRRCRSPGPPRGGDSLAAVRLGRDHDVVDPAAQVLRRAADPAIVDRHEVEAVARPRAAPVE